MVNIKDLNLSPERKKDLEKRYGLKVKASSKHLESKLQIECIEWFDVEYPTTLLFHIPNGGGKLRKEVDKNGNYYCPEGKRLKKMGLREGMPDLCIPLPRGGFHGLYVELKVNNGTISSKQEKVIAYLRNLGYRVEVCWTFDEFKKAIQSYMKGLYFRGGTS